MDQSILTGESLPLDKGPGEEVFCGTINRFGSIDIRATKVGEDSSLQKADSHGAGGRKEAGPPCSALQTGVQAGWYRPPC